MSTNEKMQAAKSLIQQKRYDEARKVLKTIHHPTARRWENKLDEIAPMKKRLHPAMIAGSFLIIGLLLGLLIGFLAFRQPATTRAAPSLLSIPAGCSVNDWWKTAEPLAVQFLDTAETASATARASLSSVILEMRSVQRSFEALDHPECVREIYYALSSGMDMAVTGFNDFLGQSETVATIELELASQYFWNAQALLKSQIIFTDIRMVDASLIWGGGSPSEAEATAMIIRLTGTPAAGG